MGTGRRAHHRVVLTSGSKHGEVDPESPVDFGRAPGSPRGGAGASGTWYDPEDPYDDGNDYGDEDR